MIVPGRLVSASRSAVAQRLRVAQSNTRSGSLSRGDKQSPISLTEAWLRSSDHVLGSSPEHERLVGPWCRSAHLNFGDAVDLRVVAEIRGLDKRCKAWPSSN
jgi:hypothetical protein